MTLPFENKTIAKMIDVLNTQVLLNVEPDVFIPSEHGIFFAQNIMINKAERVLDVGTGSGFLAILSAKLGAIVLGIDNDEKALSCARRNAVTNGVDVIFQKSDLLRSVTDNYFDVVIANLPQEIIPPILQEKIGSVRNNAISGGAKGNNIILDFLRQAYKAMEENKIGRIYIKINTLSFYKESLDYILNHFSARLLAFEVKSVKDFVIDFEDFYKPLNTQGKIHLFKINGKLYEEVFIFMLSKNNTNNK